MCTKANMLNDDFRCRPPHKLQMTKTWVNKKGVLYPTCCPRVVGEHMQTPKLETMKVLTNEQPNTRTSETKQAIEQHHQLALTQNKNKQKTQQKKKKKKTREQPKQTNEKIKQTDKHRHNTKQNNTTHNKLKQTQTPAPHVHLCPMGRVNHRWCS